MYQKRKNKNWLATDFKSNLVLIIWKCRGDECREVSSKGSRPKIRLPVQSLGISFYTIWPDDIPWECIFWLSKVCNLCMFWLDCVISKTFFCNQINLHPCKNTAFKINLDILWLRLLQQSIFTEGYCLYYLAISGTYELNCVAVIWQKFAYSVVVKTLTKYFLA